MRYLTLIGLVMLLFVPPARPAPVTQPSAQAPWPVAGICLQPADPDPAIVLRSLRVEITLLEADDTLTSSPGATGQALARVQARFSLVNPSRTTPRQITVGLPTWSTGDRFFRPAKLQGLTVRVNDTPITPIAQPRPQVENETWLAWPMSFDILDRQFVEIAYTTPLEAGPVPRVAFALSTGAIWADQVESAAIVVTAPPPFQREQILDPRPATMQYDGQQLGWHLVAFEPASQGDVEFAYITRGLWARVEAARAAVALEPSATNHRTLGALYLILADRPAFFAQAVAELETAVALDPTDVETRRTLAQAYQARGLSTNNIAYLELAIRHWEQAQALAPDDVLILANLRRCHYALAQALSGQRAYRQALQHLETALALPAASLPDDDVGNAALLQQRDRTRRLWAAYLFESGRDPEAVAVLRVLGDPYEADYQAYALPFARIHGQVSTQIGSAGGTRQITLTWTPGLTDVAALGQRLQAQVPEAHIQVLPADRGIEIRLTFANVTELRRSLAALGQGLPTSPAWDPLRAILIASELSYTENDAFLWREVRYRETLPLHTPAADLLRRKQALDALIAGLVGQAGSAPEDPMTLRLTALRSYQTATEQLLGTQVVNQVTLTSLPGHPRASVDLRLGEDRVLEAREQEWRLSRAVLCGSGTVLILGLLLALGWIGSRFQARRRRGTTTRRRRS